MRHIVLVAPQIAPNTGNIIRLCANAGATLHLIEPLGFSLDDGKLKRAGLDYHDLTTVHRHRTLDDARLVLADVPSDRWFAVTAKGATRYDTVEFRPDDVFVFGAEQTGLSPEVLATFAATHRLHLPMVPGNRSLNLANAVSVVVYEAWRQSGFS